MPSIYGRSGGGGQRIVPGSGGGGKKKGGKSLIGQITSSISSAPRALVGLGGAAAKELYRVGPLDETVEAIQQQSFKPFTEDPLGSVPLPILGLDKSHHDDIREAQKKADEEGIGFFEAWEQTSPLIGPFAASYRRLGGDIQALAPGGQPALEPWQQASDEGTIFGKVLEDVGNLALVGAVASKPVSAAAKGAGKAAKATEQATKVASRDVQAAAKAARTARTTARSGSLDPVAASRVTQADAALRVSRQALSTARQEAARASSKAATLERVAGPLQNLTRYGNIVADAPFMPITRGVPWAVGKATKAAGPLIRSTETGARVLDAVGDATNRFVERTANKATTREMLQDAADEEARLNQPVEQAVESGEALFATGKRADLDPIEMQAANLVDTGSAHDAARMIAKGADRVGVVDEVAQIRAAPPEAVELALDILDDTVTDPRVVDLRDRVIPEARALNERERLGPQSERYIDERAKVGEEAGDYARWNVEGDEPQISHLRTNADRKLTKKQERQTKQTERARERVAREAARLDDLGMTEAERANPALLVERVMAPAVELARQIVANDAVMEQLAQTDDFGKIAKQVQAGKLTPEQAVERLADRLVRLRNKPVKELSPEAKALLGVLAGDGGAPKGRMPALADVGPAQQAGAAGATVKAGTQQAERGEALVARAETAEAGAAERMEQATRGAGPKVRAAAVRVGKAMAKLQDLERRARAQTGRVKRLPDEALARKVTKTEVRKAVREARAAAKEMRAAARDEFLDRLDDVEALHVKLPRREYQKVKVKGKDNVWRTVRKRAWPPEYDWMEGLSKKHPARKYLHEPEVGRGSAPDEVLDRMRTAGLGEPEPSMADWLKDLEAAHSDDFYNAARLAEQAGMDEGFVRAALEDTEDAAIARFTELSRQTPAELLEPGGRVDTALERDFQVEQNAGTGTPGRAKLTEAERKVYDAEVARRKADVQAKIVDQKVEQTARAADAGAERARAQGQAEGALVGKGRTLRQVGETEQRAGARKVTQAQRMADMTADLDREAIKRVSGPIGRLYKRAGTRERALRDAATALRKEERALARLDERMAQRTKELFDRIDANPRPYRPMIETAQRLRDWALKEADRLDADLPNTGAGDVYRAAAAEVFLNLDEITQAGIDPVYVIGGTEAKRLAGQSAGGATRGSSTRTLPRKTKTGLESAGRGTFGTPTIREAGRAEVQRIHRIVFNKAADRIKATFGKSARSVLAENLSESALERLRPEQVDAAMREAGFVAWSPESIFEKVAPGQVSLDTQYIPKYLWDEFHRYNAPSMPGGKFGTFLKGFDTGQKAWKGSVLALTGRWHVGNIFGNAIMATLGAGLTPDEWIRALAKARKIMEPTRTGKITPEYTKFLETLPPRMRAGLVREGFAPPELLHKGYYTTEFGGDGTRQRKQLKPGMARHPLQRSYDFNSRFDDMNRLAVYLAKVERGANPADAIKMSLKAMGDYKNLSPMERSVWRRVFPFYPWLKHITGLTVNLATHHPLRVAWTLHLADMFDDDDIPVEFLRGAIPLGDDRWVRLPNINPFNDVANVLAVGDEGFDPSGTMSSISPLISTPAALVGGVDFRTAGGAVRTATGGTDQFGRDKPTPLLPGLGGSFKETGYFLGSQVPQVAALREAIPAIPIPGIRQGSAPIRRYPTGEPYIVDGKFIPGNTQEFIGTRTGVPDALAPFMPLIGAPRQEMIRADDIAARAEEKKKKAAEKKAKYEKDRKAARKKARKGQYAE